ncbi:mycofactocin-associated electron transfer flavoprotein alpha subunit [Kutzneria kofuensis]|uniref:Electron transfer flavoprotein alpha subunit n=1 Tax=Kutzneria kofuensis TaxID=103725 RepID=A0A7W9NKC2_9PSEU|nr:mycofactocin-associated electron transfer flavoprotein alpha subunit [Kutzneria kofuensis]MBB5895118.1 electron transfer flavoprotein alpha subunit [Kutzneria kofuensis]
MIDTDFLAVLVVRDGELPLGADEVAAEAGGSVLVVGTNAKPAAEQLIAARTAWVAESPTVAPGALSAALAPLLRSVRAVVLIAAADGRDLAPRLAYALRRPLLSGANAVTTKGADVLRRGSQGLQELTPDGPFVVTLQPGVRGAATEPEPPRILEIELTCGDVADARSLGVETPKAQDADLAEARRVLGAGAGLVSGHEQMELLTKVGERLGAATGATRVVTDAGFAGHERQIGTTGVVIDPELYVAFGISGAAQHVGGLGAPRHVISVNTDPCCPMTAMADLGIVADAPAVLAELARRLEESHG